MPVKIENLSYVYMPNTPFQKKALENISINIADGEFIGLIGHTGSGKSTLIQQINGLLKPTEGKVYIDEICLTDKNVELKKIRHKVGIVFQYPEHQLFEETIYKDIAFGPTNLGLNPEQVEDRVKRAMKFVGIDYERYKDKSPFEMSGGQKRRVAIAGVLAMEPRVLILDEPTAGLDPRGRNEILNQIKNMHKEYKMTIIMVSHSMEEVAQLADRLIVLDKGRVVLEGAPREVFSKIDVLEKIGLAAPQVTYLARNLRSKGFDIKEDIMTIEEAKHEILRVLRRRTL
ncbi:Energy-coupling factor transporter ATP-binding protein EcfA2 [Caloramator mitchellensis]|uniref:Energy-coupling factor transporter ATP-binding protein EcfA2 n=1 Tax=Caloramator mitchellensis TaxID=908809 RepID=A0A0R3JUM7_CALMK|nr:energy-coupling factor transporter ATPase [Caloramator mitchellensis]KRQ87267.1 Energy-coupling factor transporter ATP-binding protein EcfA2 [Caloramator mitchellensis]